MLFRSLTEGQIEEIHNTSLKIFEEVGVCIKSAPARELWRKAGAVVDENTGICKIGKEIVDYCIAAAPKEFTQYGRDPRHKMCIRDRMSVCMVFPQIYDSVGGMAGIRAATAPSFTHPVAGMTFSKALMLVLLCINVYADPCFYQRFSASNSAKTGRRAMLTCFCLWLVFDAVTSMAGMAVHVKYPGVQPELAYVQMVLSELPVGIRAFFVIGLFGAIISTLDSYYLIGGTTLAKDIYARIFAKEELSDKKLVNLSRAGAGILGVIGLALALRFTLVYDAFVFLISLWMSTGFVLSLIHI